MLNYQRVYGNLLYGNIYIWEYIDGNINYMGIFFAVFLGQYMGIYGKQWDLAHVNNTLIESNVAWKIQSTDILHDK
jgi:hypothetical protein